MDGRGQIFTWDLVFSTLIFLILLFVMIFIWDTSIVDVNLQEEEYEMNWLSKTVTKTLVMTSGVPEEWNLGNVEVYGLAKTSSRGETISTISHVVDANKLMYFVYDGSNNYDKARKKLLSSSKYNYYVEFSCLNESSVDCFQGLRLDAVNFDIKCINPFKFTVTDFMTDTYKWVEAESLWDNVSTGNCISEMGECSGNQSILVHNSPGDKEVDTNQGEYNIWVRCIQSTGFRLRVNEVEVDGVCDEGDNLFNWSLEGSFNLTRHTRIGFNGTPAEAEVDVLLLTTNLDYDPRASNRQYFGNPNVIKKCLVGNFSANVVKAVSNSNTASFSESLTDLELLSGKQPYLPKTIKVKTVVWKRGS